MAGLITVVAVLYVVLNIMALANVCEFIDNREAKLWQIVVVVLAPAGAITGALVSLVCEILMRLFIYIANFNGIDWNRTYKW